MLVSSVPWICETEGYKEGRPLGLENRVKLALKELNSDVRGLVPSFKARQRPNSSPAEVACILSLVLRTPESAIV